MNISMISESSQFEILYLYPFSIRISHCVDFSILKLRCENETSRNSRASRLGAKTGIKLGLELLKQFVSTNSSQGGKWRGLWCSFVQSLSWNDLSHGPFPVWFQGPERKIHLKKGKSEATDFAH